MYLIRIGGEVSASEANQVFQLMGNIARRFRPDRSLDWFVRDKVFATVEWVDDLPWELRQELLELCESMDLDVSIHDDETFCTHDQYADGSSVDYMESLDDGTNGSVLFTEHDMQQHRDMTVKEYLALKTEKIKPIGDLRLKEISE